MSNQDTRTKLKHWVELFFGVNVIAMNSHRLPVKGQMHYRRMIITLQRSTAVSAKPPLNMFVWRFSKKPMLNPSFNGGSLKTTVES
ncbi:50S ribosomal protein l23 chloroplastic [Phtheirospermum japonicum]|uniref:50S ribosomal protein l23 chloroplastic n=1 Tax=Phtheirospermum japonicum TaxID=374723 RepID=A0A830AWX1_9LAMI|nr:50S ribosomal protein l23 chloroplastic [Phtheirospermum japonicum]